MTFWGSPKRLGLLPYFVTVAQNSPPSHVDATLGQAETGRPGVAEELLASAGFRILNRGTALVTNEFPDLDTFVRAAIAAGPPSVSTFSETGSRVYSWHSGGDGEVVRC